MPSEFFDPAEREADYHVLYEYVLEMSSIYMDARIVRDLTPLTCEDALRDTLIDAAHDTLDDLDANIDITSRESIIADAWAALYDFYLPLLLRPCDCAARTTEYLRWSTTVHRINEMAITTLQSVFCEKCGCKTRSSRNPKHAIIAWNNGVNTTRAQWHQTELVPLGLRCQGAGYEREIPPTGDGK
jgi:hypothetical protein